MTRAMFLLFVLTAAGGVARADAAAVPTLPPLATVTDGARTDARADAGRHVVYVELFGKGDLYGVGYDYRLTPRLGAGAAVSAYQIHERRLLTLNPYVSAYPLIHGRHALFAHAGPKLVDDTVKSPVPQLPDQRSTSIGGQLSLGYEHTGRVIVRAYVMVAAGAGGVFPWGGVTVGAAL